MNAAREPGHLLVSALASVALGIALGVVGVFTLAAVAGQEPVAEAATVQVLEYGTR
jgi:hypothetical protein